MRSDIIIIGGGASALACAIAVKQQSPGLSVTILEAADRVGKKLLATGNGRCNIGNLFASPPHYHSVGGQAAAFVSPALERFPAAANSEWFEALGLPLTADQLSGRQYPLSNQAASVLDVLRLSAGALGVSLLTNRPANRIKYRSGQYQISAGDQVYECQKLVLAWGGISSPQISAAQNRERLCHDLGLETTPLYPALTQIKTREKLPAALKGLRLHCHIKLTGGGAIIQQTSGELQFTEYGVSGIPAFELSRAISLTPTADRLEIDCLPDRSLEWLTAVLSRRQQLALPLSDFLTGLLNKKLGQQILKLCGLAPLSRSSAGLNRAELEQIARQIKCLRLSPDGVTGWQNAQVTAGGLKLSQFDPQSLSCISQPGLYAIGEALDIDGDCGGFNLTWAWSSARLAAAHLCAAQ